MFAGLSAHNDAQRGLPLFRTTRFPYATRCHDCEVPKTQWTLVWSGWGFGALYQYCERLQADTTCIKTIPTTTIFKKQQRTNFCIPIPFKSFRKASNLMTRLFMFPCARQSSIGHEAVSPQGVAAASSQEDAKMPRRAPPSGSTRGAKGRHGCANKGHLSEPERVVELFWTARQFKQLARLLAVRAYSATSLCFCLSATAASLFGQ
eukprot:4980547-Amphidinium_carterae.1